VIDASLGYGEQLRSRAEALATICVHAGEEADASGALDTPIVLSSAFAFDSADHAARAFRGEEDAWIYGRWGNPTVLALEKKLAAIEGAEAACATASGMAAIAGVVLATCSAGDHIVAPRAMYAESARLFRERLPKLGITTTFVDGTRDAYAAAITNPTRMPYVETPSNPVCEIADIAGLAQIAREAGAVLAVDNCMASPALPPPVALGADLVVHSAPKYPHAQGPVLGRPTPGPEMGGGWRWGPARCGSALAA